MQWKNTKIRYGWVAIFIHWIMALAIIGMFILGKFMVDLDYYSLWYQIAPDTHRSIGLLIAALLLVRFAWRIANPAPVIEGKQWEKRIAHTVHLSFYLLLLMIVISGYLITTADGQGVTFFGWFDVPAFISGIDHQEDIAGEVHNWLAIATMLLAGLHTAAALKHHFIERDNTLLKMFGRSSKN